MKPAVTQHKTGRDQVKEDDSCWTDEGHPGARRHRRMKREDFTQLIVPGQKAVRTSDNFGTPTKLKQADECQQNGNEAARTPGF